MTGGTVLSCQRYRWGLGNRMRSLLGAACLAQAEQRVFRYTWPVGKEFGARLTDLWGFDAPRVPTWVSSVLATAYPYRDGGLEWLDDTARRARLWQLRTPHELALPDGYPDWTALLRALRPTPPIAQRIHEMHDPVAGQRYVGVMVRAHAVSHEATRQHSPVEWYRRRIREIREQHPSALIYLSCDDPGVQRSLMADVEGCVAQGNKGAYNSQQGLESAVVDLYLLAGSARLIGPHYSSFPELAQNLAGGHVMLETSQSTGDVSSTAAAMPAPAVDPTRPWMRG